MRSFEGGAVPQTYSSAISSATSVTSYVYWGTPTSQGQTGVRGFAGDSSGVLCFSSDGAAATTTGDIGVNTNDAATCNVLQ